MTVEWLPLKPFQEEAASFLAEREHAFLCDEMGVGKSAAAIRACDLVGADRVLVLAPANARTNWLREFTRFSPFDRPAVTMLKRTDAPGAKGVTVCSYEIARCRDARLALMHEPWDALILDEAHTLKNRTAINTRSVYGYRMDNKGGIMAAAKRCWRLSGTLAPNNVSEIWTHLHSSGIYTGTWYDFVGEFCTGYSSDYGFKITGTKNPEKLKALIKPFVLRRTKDQVLPDMPPVTFEHLTLEPGPVDIPLLFPDWLQGRTLAEFNAELEALNATVASTLKGKEGGALDAAIAALAASSSALRRYVGCSIVDAYVTRVREELRRGDTDKLVIFAHHRAVIDALRAGLVEFDPATVYGGTAPDKRDRLIDSFNKPNGRRLFIGQLQAAGTAINLQAAHRLDFVEMSWVPGENAQAAMRVHRQGQKNHCHIRFFGCGKGIHADIAAACARKSAELIKVGL